MRLLLDFPTGILQSNDLQRHIISQMPHGNHAFCAGVMESCPSSPLFVPLGMERSAQNTRKLSKDGGALSTDSEDVNGSAKERKRHKRHQGPRSQRGEGKSLEELQAHKKENKPPSNTKEQLQTSAKEHASDKENSVTENKTKVPGECKSFPAMWFPTLYCACEQTRPLDGVACQRNVKL